MRKIKYKGNTIKMFGDEQDDYFHDVEVDPFFSDVLDFLDEKSVVLDVGGNIGITSLVAATHGCSVYSFEPGPRAFLYLKKNAEHNEGLRIFPQNIALGAENNEIGFFDHPPSAAVSHLSNDHTLGNDPNTLVKMIKLDDFVSTHDFSRIDLVKIDVEGFEIDVLKGAAETLKKFKPSVFVEFNSFCMIAFRNINPREMLSNIRSLFPFVYEYKKSKIKKISSDVEALSFIHDNLVVNGCVNDLYCRFDEI